MLLNEMEIFYYVVALKSFSKTADKLSVSKSFISKAISKLENELKARLLIRTTRKLTLTEAGEKFYRHCEKIVEEGNKGYSFINESLEKPSGNLKISVPPALGMNLLAPMFSQFLKKYPEINLDVALESRVIDLIGENYDLALRVAKLEDSNLIAQKIFTIKSVICATPKYLKSHGIPRNHSDIRKHNFAIYSYSKNAKSIRLSKNQVPYVVPIAGNFLSNQLDLIKKMVLCHSCMAFLPEFMVQEEIKKSQIKICLPDYVISESPLYIIYSEKEFMPIKVKLFLEMLKEFFVKLV